MPSIMPRDNAYVAVYDVCSDNERDRVAQVLEGFGLRVQFSVFELRLTPSSRQRLMRQLKDLKIETGFIYLYRRAGGHDRSAAGRVPPEPLAEANHAFVLVGESPRPRKTPNPSVNRKPLHPRPGGRPAPAERPLSDAADCQTNFNPVLPPVLGVSATDSPDASTRSQGESAITGK